ncbi:ATP-binding protein [Streptomyces sp. NPDC048637]|uniref:ATP-binding protein n=1 Tax=Streptomyces sp. NPDC048637 TaxID=3155636 RepID=UPI0034244408
MIPGQESAFGSEIPLAGTKTPGIPGLERLSAIALCALPTEERAAAKARSFTRAQLRTWGVGEDVTYEACILVSELVTNTLQHSGAEGFCVGLARSGRRLCIEVTDDGEWQEPAAPAANDVAECGRGLALANALTQGFGVHRTPSGTCAWALLADGTETGCGTFPDVCPLVGTVDLIGGDAPHDEQEKTTADRSHRTLHA